MRLFLTALALVAAAAVPAVFATPGFKPPTLSKCDPSTAAPLTKCVTNLVVVPSAQVPELTSDEMYRLIPVIDPRSGKIINFRILKDGIELVVRP